MIDPLAHIQTNNYGMMAAQSLRLAARKQGTQKSFYFFPLVMDTFNGDTFKVVLPKDLKWENQTKLQNLNPCVTAVLLRKNLEDICQFQWTKAKHVQRSIAGTYAIIEIYVREHAPESPAKKYKKISGIFRRVFFTKKSAF